MQRITARLPSGMRDFLPLQMIRRQYVISTIAAVFESFGYEPFQTPVMELKEVLQGKYGADAERLIYYAGHPGGEEELALRYDLTVPLARAFAQHENDLRLPFRRYQIAPVWRGETPQRGRYREFLQCDADIVGIGTMDADAEIIGIVDMAMSRLGFPDYAIKINNRKLLTGIGHYAGLEGDALANLYRSIDKADKIGLEGVQADLLKQGISAEVAAKIIAILKEARPGELLGIGIGLRKIAALREQLAGYPSAEEGLADLTTLFELLQTTGAADAVVEFDPSMVRGLSYYTSTICETVLMSGDSEERVGSVSGGGRYDDLIGLFRKESLPTVGISLGIERLIYLMDKRNLYPAHLNSTIVQVMVAVFPDTRRESAALAMELRRAGLRVELYLGGKAKLGDQFTYAAKKGIPLVALMGSSELNGGMVKLKNLATKEEMTVSRTECPDEIRRHIV
ncbi:MAG TPA: histidine--tRNA ligase [Aggregatilineales bacterium]|nr:histidine--tRNA ligase [Anaerolineales bacterium]HRE48904.1 histidine--tRNA ligase [Aggregatilineales bacterium]